MCETQGQRTDTGIPPQLDQPVFKEITSRANGKGWLFISAGPGCPRNTFVIQPMAKKDSTEERIIGEAIFCTDADHPMSKQWVIALFDKNSRDRIDPLTGEPITDEKYNYLATVLTPYGEHLRKRCGFYPIFNGSLNT